MKPNRPLNLILGVFLGALLSLGSVVVAEFMRDTVLTPRDLELLTGQRVLASLPNTGRRRQSASVEPRAVREALTSSRRAVATEAVATKVVATEGCS